MLTVDVFRTTGSKAYTLPAIDMPEAKFLAMAHADDGQFCQILWNGKPIPEEDTEASDLFHISIER